jgi:glycosyltransferase involved in cell wall biosynthesis
LLLDADFQGKSGGLALAFKNLRTALELRGWIVEPPPAAASGASPVSYPVSPLLAASLRSKAIVRMQSRLPPRLRRWLVNLTRPAAFFERASAALTTAEQQLKEGQFDSVLVCVHPHRLPGLVGLATSLHPSVVAVSLAALGDEMRYSWLWAVMRVVARVRLRGRAHPCLGRPVDPTTLRHAVFASSIWRRDALRAGLDPEHSSTIYFGVAVPAPVARGPWKDRLLWVGRMAPEKGLHELLAAYPTVRSRVPGVTLTAIAGQGPASYARLIHEQLPAGNAFGVTLRDACPRSALPDVFREHDALVFYSVFAEPVALVVLEAFAAGLPVIAKRPASREGPLREEETCLCFDPADADSLVRAVERLRADPTLRSRLTERAREVVEREYSIDSMGGAYDRLLHGLIPQRR